MAIRPKMISRVAGETIDDPSDGLLDAGIVANVSHTTLIRFTVCEQREKMPAGLLSSLRMSGSDMRHRRCSLCAGLRAVRRSHVRGVREKLVEKSGKVTKK